QLPTTTYPSQIFYVNNALLHLLHPHPFQRISRKKPPIPQWLPTRAKSLSQAPRRSYTFNKTSRLSRPRSFTPRTRRKFKRKFNNFSIHSLDSPFPTLKLTASHRLSFRKKETRRRNSLRTTIMR